MESNGVVAHRFANKDFGKYGSLQGSSTHISGRNYFSYSTVFGQWVDIKNNVCLVYWGSTSNSSNRHKLWNSDFPKDVVVLPYNDNYRNRSYNYGWSGCNLISEYRVKDEDFDWNARRRLLDYYVGTIYDQFEYLSHAKTKGAEYIDFKYWEYVEKLCSMYKDTSVAKWIKEHTIGDDKVVAREKKLAKLLMQGERDVKTIVDALFGEGTYQSYYDYCARYRNAETNKQKMIDLCHRLGMSSPYDSYHEGYYHSNKYAPCSLKAKEIRALTAKQRVELHFENLAYIEACKTAGERKAKFEKNRANAHRWIVGFEPLWETIWNGSKRYDDSVEKVRNMYTGEVYEIGDGHIDFRCYEMKQRICFDYESFRKSDDKQAWIEKFYSDCAEIGKNVKALAIFMKINATYEEIGGRFGDHKYIDDDHLKENTTAEEYAVCKDFIIRWDEVIARKEARVRAAEIERQRKEEEARREREYREQVKQEQIDACIARGAEGCRDIWRQHLDSIEVAHREFDKVELTGCPARYKEFFYSGNVLLRLNLDKTYVESSKRVRVPVSVAKVWFRKVKQWHENPSTFKPMTWDTKGNGTYTVSSYKNDILTAGCHDISYAEMERMYNQILAETA